MKKRLSTVFATLTLALASVVSLTGCEEDPGIVPIYNDEGQIQIRMSSDSCEDSNYESTIKKLKKYGFKNFKINYMNDVIIGLLVSEDSIDSININGKSYFDSDDYFDATSVIYMNVHSKHGGVDITASPIDGIVPIMYENEELNGQNVLDVIQAYKNIGFTNFVYDPIYDCSSTSSSNYNLVSGLSVNGKKMYYYYDCFSTDTPIKVTYHTTQESSGGGSETGGGTETGGGDPVEKKWYEQDYTVEETHLESPGELEINLESFNFTASKIYLNCSFTQFVLDSLTISFTGWADVYYYSKTEGITSVDTSYTKQSSYNAAKNKKTTFQIPIVPPNDANMLAVTAIDFSIHIKGMLDGEVTEDDLYVTFEFTSPVW